MALEYRTLGRTGLRLSVLGFGASPIGGVFGRVDERECERAVHAAVDRGVNFFDTSPYYGLTLSEERLGGALQGRRNHIILSTKCGRYGEREFDFSRQRIERSIDESLGRLRTDYVDLLLLHDVEFGEPAQLIDEALPALEQVRQSGKARFVGVTGLPVNLLERLAHASDADCVLTYCRNNLLNIDAEALVPLSVSRGVGLINASPLHMGLLTPQGPPPWHPGPAEVHTAARAIVALCGGDVAGVALRYAVVNKAFATTLAGMATVEELERNLEALERQTDPQLLCAIEEIARPARGLIWQSGRSSAA